MSTNVRPRPEGAYKLQSREGLREARAVGSAILAGWFGVKVGLSERFPYRHCGNNEMHSGAPAETWWVLAAQEQG